MIGIINDGNSRPITPVRVPLDKYAEREKLQERAKIAAITVQNRAMHSEKVQKDILNKQEEKKVNSKLTKYLTDRDTLAALQE